MLFEDEYMGHMVSFNNKEGSQSKRIGEVGMPPRWGCRAGRQAVRNSGLERNDLYQGVGS